MKYEIMKILTNRYLQCLLAGVVLANGILFYCYCVNDSKGYTLSQVQQMYDLPMDELIREHEILRERTVTEENPYDDTLVTGDVFKESWLYQEVIERKEACQTYAEQIKAICQEAEVKKIFFASNDPYTNDVLNKTVEVYQSLETVVPEESFSGGVEVLGEWRISDLFVLLAGCVVGMFLITQERSRGMSCLLRPTKYGRIHMFMNKFRAMCVLVFLEFIVIYGTNFVIAGTLFGIGNVSRAVQSVYGLEACPYALSVGGYLSLLLIGKLLCGLAASAVFFLICTCTSRSAVALSCGFVAGVLSVWMARSSSLWVRAWSLWFAEDILSYLKGSIYLNLFGNAFPQLYAVLIGIVSLFILSTIIACIIFCRQSAIGNAGKLHIHFPTLRTTSIWLQEGWKVLFLQGGLIVLIIFGIVQSYNYKDFYIQHDLRETFYARYSELLSGEPSKEKEEYLLQEMFRYEQIKKELEESGDDIDKVTELDAQLLVEPAFESAFSQYQRLSGSQKYVYETGYNRLYNHEGISDDLKNTLLLALAMILVLSGVFAIEEESGMKILQCSSGNQKRIIRSKLIWSAVFLLVAMTIAYLPQYMSVYKGYGLPLLSAQANSLSIFCIFPDAISILGILLLTLGIRLVLASVVGILILWISKKTGSTVITMLLCVGAIILPLIITILLYK